MIRQHLKTALVFMLAFLLFGVILVSYRVIHARDSDLVASLEKLAGGIEVKRVGTDQWITINHESLVGVGDSIRTDKAGHARITFFANGTDTEVLPNSEFRIDAFSGTDTQYQLSVTIVLGETTQRIAKLLDSGSSYTINSTGLELGVRGTEFAVRVEQGGRSATIVKSGAVKAKNNGTEAKTTTDPKAEASIPTGMGVRAEASKGLSEVVPAASFQELDMALDGCKVILSGKDDVRFNVRSGPDLKFPRIGNIDNNAPLVIVGITKTTQWYRTAFKGGFGWFLSTTLKLDPTCTMLRKFPDDSSSEDTTLYKDLDSDIVLTPTAAPQATEAATSAP